jgi:hypothetical protein
MAIPLKQVNRMSPFRKLPAVAVPSIIPHAKTVVMVGMGRTG